MTSATIQPAPPPMPPSQPALPPAIQNPFQNQQYLYNQPAPPLPQNNQPQQVITNV